MKQRFILLFLSLTVVAFAQQVNFQSGSFIELKAKAKSENKFLFVDCMTEWCIWCKVMNKETFPDKNVAGLMNQKFIATQIDMEKNYGITLALKYRVAGFPTFLVFNADGKLVYRIIGYQKPVEFLASLNAAITPDKQQNFAGISDKIELDFPQFYKDAFGGKSKSKRPDEKTVNDFLNMQKDLTDEISWSIMSRFKTSEQNNQYFLDNIERYRTLYNLEAEEHLQSIISRVLNAAIRAKSEEQYGGVLNYIEKYANKDKKESQQQSALQFYSGVGNWENFTSSFENYLSTNGYTHAETINQYCWKIYEECDDASVISKACEWMKQATISAYQYAYLDTYAALLFKNKNYNEALLKAKEAIEKGKEEKQDTQSTEELLKKINDRLQK